ncbi:uncharacterized protein LOC5508128 isoform X2 [Nematostella vectensis]|uniref:uncharacterized protein LOC5508128 isoform X2 n=1 Tax=Nematostella vectensis TaxID=45351 RepID=UPI0020777679|nr:uncharacterized protein LOC5508128 isoform X2 [Nematostella vectensis]
MEPPELVRWSPPENDNTNAELFDFELGGKDDSFDLEQQAHEVRKRVVGLLQERNRLLVRIRELQSRNTWSKEGDSCEGIVSQDEWIRTRMKSETGSDSSTTDDRGIRKFSSCGSNYGQEYWQGRGVRLSQESGVEDSDSTDFEAFSAEDQDLIHSLQKANQHLHSAIEHLQQISNSKDIYEDTFDDVNEDTLIRRQLGELVTETKQYEKVLRIKDPELSKQLDEYLKNFLSEEEIQLLAETETNMSDELSAASKECGVQTDGLDCNLPNGEVPSSQVVAECVKEERKKTTTLGKECSDLREKLKEVTAEKNKLEEENHQLHEHYANQEAALQIQVEKLQEEVKHYQNVIIEFQACEATRKSEVDQVLLQARDVLERERQEKYASISEQNALRRQIENLSKTMKSMQFKNEELVRFQYNQEDQVDDFKRLKKLIQDNGLPTIEQVIVLQRQNESYREELMNERKEKERLLSIKDKLRRDLDSTQSRISSLQEQVYKYREHIYFLQQRAKQDNPGSPLIPTPSFEPIPPPSPTSLANASRLYGNNAQQYINESLLQSNAAAAASRKYPLMPFPEGKKGPPGKHGGADVSSKQWSNYMPQQNAYQGGGKFGRQLSLDAGDWKQRSNQGQVWSTDNSFNPQPTRHNSSSSYSSMRSSSSLGSGSSDEGLDTNLEKPGQYGVAGRRQNGRTSDEFRPMQNYGPPASTFEAWPRQSVSNNRMPNPRSTRRYPSPVGNGMRSPSDFWTPQQQAVAVPKPWQTQVDHTQYGGEAIQTGMRQSADPWQQSTTLATSQAQSVAVTSAGNETSSFGGFGGGH